MAEFDLRWGNDGTFDLSFGTAGKPFNTDFGEVQYKTITTLDVYEGSYDITPLVTSQVMGTKDKMMADDVTIEMIPTREVENQAGGISFIIG